VSDELNLLRDKVERLEGDGLDTSEQLSSLREDLDKVLDKVERVEAASIAAGAALKALETAFLAIARPLIDSGLLVGRDKP